MINKRFVFFLGFFLLALNLYSIALAQLNIDGGLYNEDLQVFYLSDFDLTQSGAGPLIFWIRLENNSDTARSVVLSLLFKSDNYGTLIQATSAPFTMAAGEVREATNQDLTTKAQDYTLQDYNIGGAANDLKDAILRTGELPADTYTFVLTIEDADDPSVKDSVILGPLTLSNPTTLDLVSPGASPDSGELPVIFTTSPLFQWQSNASQFRITVCEELSTDSSPEDVMDNLPRLKREVSGLSFQYPEYPTTGEWPLEEGKTYFWQVEAIVTTTSGLIYMPSEIWGFRIGELGAGMLSAEQAQILSFLHDVLGNDFDRLIEQGGELEGFDPTGVVLKDGQRISLTELIALGEKFSNGEYRLFQEPAVE